VEVIFVRDLLLLTVVLLIAGSAVSPVRSNTGKQMDESNRRRAEELWEKAITAKGGRARLQKVQTLLISSKASRRGEHSEFRGLHRRVEEVYVFPEKYWVWDDSRPGRFGLSIEMFNGKEYWLARDIDPESPSIVPLTEQVLKTRRFFLQRVQAYFLLETPWFRPIPERVKSGWIGLKRVDIVYARAGQDTLVVYLDRKSHLPLKAALLDPRADVDDPEWVDLFAAVFDDYQEIYGIQMPHKVGWGPVADGQYTYQVNPSIDERLFHQAPKIEHGPEAWKPQSARR
jgi:hypothetical protein